MVIIIGAVFVIIGVLMLAPAPFITFLPQRFVRYCTFCGNVDNLASNLCANIFETDHTRVLGKNIRNLLFSVAVTVVLILITMNVKNWKSFTGAFQGLTFKSCSKH